MTLFRKFWHFVDHKKLPHSRKRTSIGMPSFATSKRGASCVKNCTRYVQRMSDSGVSLFEKATYIYCLPYTILVFLFTFQPRPGLSGSQVTPNQTRGLICIDILPVSLLTIPPFIKHLRLRWNQYRHAPPQHVDQARHRNS